MKNWVITVTLCLQIFLISTDAIEEIDMFLQSPEAGAQYVKERTPMKYLDAHKNCLSKGGRLAVMKNVNEVNQMAAANPDKAHSFIGLTDTKVEGKFVWTNGAVFSAYNHLHFKPGKPDNHNNNEQCVIVTDATSGLEDTSCDTPHQFICQIHPNLAQSKAIVYGAVFEGGANGVLLIEFQGNHSMKVRGMVGAAESDASVAAVLLHEPKTGEPICKKPTPLYEVYNKFVFNLKATLPTANNFRGRHVISVVVPNISDNAPNHYGIAIRRNSKSGKHVDCADIQTFSAMQWYNKVADIDFKFANGMI